MKKLFSRFRVESEFDISELSNKIKSVSAYGWTETIISILDDLIDEKKIELVGGLRYRYKKEIQSPNFKVITQDAWKEFETFISTQYRDYDAFLDKGARDAFDSIIKLLLIKFFKSSISLTNQKETLPIDNFKSEIVKEIGRFQMTSNLSKRYADLFYTHLQSKPPKLSDLIFERYLTLVNIDLLEQEKELPDITFENDVKFLLADTSFLVALLAKLTQSILWR